MKDEWHGTVGPWPGQGRVISHSVARFVDKIPPPIILKIGPFGHFDRCHFAMPAVYFSCERDYAIEFAAFVKRADPFIFSVR